MKVGFIGLGQMGSGMAANILKAGHEVTVFNRTRSRADDLVARGAKAAQTPADACRGDAVISMLANDEAVESVVYGEQGVLASLPRARSIYRPAQSASPWPRGSPPVTSQQVIGSFRPPYLAVPTWPRLVSCSWWPVAPRM